ELHADTTSLTNTADLLESISIGGESAPGWIQSSFVIWDSMTSTFLVQLPEATFASGQTVVVTLKPGAWKDVSGAVLE
ncbi:hypothetical protein MXD81_27345, partial [Microbacteriaceae bacterium K1510]|nr:hypothetical protein [Microbacteriaceae bacterium K1510]